MAANFAKVVACHDEFHDAVGKYEVRERGKVSIRVRVNVDAKYNVYNKMQRMHYSICTSLCV